MRLNYLKFAALLAVIIGAMAVIAGGKVILGQSPDYYVIEWLPVYIFALGFVSVFITSVLIWKHHRLAYRQQAPRSACTSA